MLHDNQGEEAGSEAVFETGLLCPERMTAEWITSGLSEDEKACPVFFKDIKIKGDVKKARIYATALGLYEISLDRPMIQFAYQMSMAELAAQASQAKPLYEMVIGALNAQYK